MSVFCPKCHSNHIDILNLAKKSIGTVGTLAGATSGAAGVIQGARAGFSVVSALPPGTHPYAQIAAVIIGCLVGGATGCAIGVSLGEMVDENILDNFLCLECGHTFSLNKGEISNMNMQFGEGDYPLHP